ncbi:MAG: hypothetical protein GY789_28180 [Hyphomicrobiales bacterium]|nr:hypothetical protein [Hyphomicrobiales bacterium]MCP5000171.1 hypothetical protein [Hyphomicrobiales bacterium]
MNFYDTANVVTRLSRGERAGWLRRRRQLIRLLNDLHSPPDRIRAEKMKKRVLQPVLKLCERRAGRHAFPSALQWHAKAARQSLDRIAYPNSNPSPKEIEVLRTHLHSCVTMIDAMLSSKEPAAMDELFQKIIGGPSHCTPSPFSHN